MTKATPLQVFDTAVHVDRDGRFSLNDIHKAAMAKRHATKSQRPGVFLDSASVKAYIAEIDGDAGNPASVVVRKGGKNQGTYATRLVALRYAGWISPKVEIEVYQTFDRVVRADESLTANLIDRQQDPEASKRLAVRAQGKVARNALTSTLAAHGVSGYGFARCTNAIYKPILGGPASEIRQRRRLPTKANVREHMSGKELAAVMLSEEIAREKIDETNAHGNDRCARECDIAGRKVRSIL